MFDLTTYAKQHRLRTRDLNRGGPCPPAKWKRPKGWPRNLQDDNFWAIVGRDGYLNDDGGGVLGIACFHRSGRGCKRSITELQRIGGTISQIGDTECAGTIPIDRIEDGIKLIRASKLRIGGPGNPDFGAKVPSMGAKSTLVLNAGDLP